MLLYPLKQVQRYNFFFSCQIFSRVFNDKLYLFLSLLNGGLLVRQTYTLINNTLHISAIAT